VLLAVLVALASGGIAYSLFQRYGNPEYQANVLAETERTDQGVTVRFEVLGRAGAGSAMCRIRARGIDGAIVGTSDVAVPAGRRVEKIVSLTTVGPTVLTDIQQCWRAPA
jgi:hypothetical protein